MNFWERNNFGTQNGTYNNSNANGAYGNQNVNGSYGSGAYCNQNGNGTYGNQYANGAYNNQNSNGNSQRTQATEQDVRQKFEQYSSKSEEQLLGELSGLAERMKSDGSFDPVAIENMYNTASPFLNDMQRQRMRQLIDMLVK